ncbi:glycerol-3-phosphate acyltransferase [Bacillus horti]|uniref:Glycerol-3-phosphate acyltransferase n=1 Tax=Caldalkalibacillus horti TaxID=77523 RepID=A0ABT9W0I9_9BACI|nr:glycerol-3-phosphate acyltransferase [Bacillus horti]MDQ0166754.1 glycerol-3-phosphate acyltransferase PlsY [Bacillus horti]
MELLLLSFYCVIAYLVGSIPVGKIVAASRGVNIQETGTGNIGASNTYLVLGKKAGIIVLLCDLGKAYVMMLVTFSTFSLGMSLFVGLFLLAGNIKSIFLGFTGGKGVATGIGIFLATYPLVAVITFTFWVLSTVFIRYLSFIGIAGVLLISFTYYRVDYELLAFICSLLLCVAILYRNRHSKGFMKATAMADESVVNVKE